MNHIIKKDFENLEIPIVDKLYTFIKNFHPIMMKFEKLDKHTFGENITKMCMLCISTAITANNQTKYNKERYLVDLSANIETLKIYVRLCRDLDVIKDIRQYLLLQDLLIESSKMTMGWIKYTRNQTTEDTTTKI